MNKYLNRLVMNAVVISGSQLGCTMEISENGAWDGETIAETEQAVVGGAETNARPAVGFLGDWCTATLVGPRHIATAAHCVGYANGVYNATFKMKTTGGVPLPVRNIDRVWSLHPAVGPRDLAIGRLSTSVPAAEATPAAFNDVLPVAGANVTMFGYGCNDRPSDAGWGTKRSRSYAYTTPTRFTCARDSGGPRVIGGPGGNGNIWAIHSGIDPANADPNGIDFHAETHLWGNAVLWGVQAFGGTTYTNTGVANFPTLAATAGAKLVSGDFDGDGRTDDLAAVGMAGNETVAVAFGNGSGGYTTTNLPMATFPSWARQARSVVAGDFDGDGDTDIALVGVGAKDSMPIALSSRNGNFTLKDEAIVDFADWSRVAGAYALAGDFDADGDADIALLGGTGWNTLPVASSRRDGRFTVTNSVVADIPAWSRVAGARGTVGDYNNDGDDDIALTGGVGWTTIPVAHSLRAGAFSRTNTSNPSFASWSRTAQSKLMSGDFDADGDDDLAVVGGSGDLFVGVASAFGNGAFTAVALPMPEVPSWANVARAAFAGRVNAGIGSDIILTGGTDWLTIPTVFVRP